MFFTLHSINDIKPLLLNEGIFSWDKALSTGKDRKRIASRLERIISITHPQSNAKNMASMKDETSMQRPVAFRSVFSAILRLIIVCPQLLLSN